MADLVENDTKSISLENFSHQVWRAIGVSRRESPKRILKEAVQESDSPFIWDGSVKYGKRSVPAREEKKELAAGFQNLRRIPNEFPRVWHVFDEVAGRDGIEGFRPEWEVCREICDHGVFNIGIFDQVAGKHIGTDDPHPGARIKGTLTGSGIKNEGVWLCKMLDGVPVRRLHVEALQIPRLNSSSNAPIGIEESHGQGC